MNSNGKLKGFKRKLANSFDLSLKNFAKINETHKHIHKTTQKKT
jgi:cytidylate kinase